MSVSENLAACLLELLAKLGIDHLTTHKLH